MFPPLVAAAAQLQCLLVRVYNMLRWKRQGLRPRSTDKARKCLPLKFGGDVVLHETVPDATLYQEPSVFITLERETPLVQVQREGIPRHTPRRPSWQSVRLRSTAPGPPGEWR
jgi:hypothetical protein